MQPPDGNASKEATGTGPLSVPALLAALPFPTYVIGSELQILYANADWEQFVRASADTLHPRPELARVFFLDCLPAEERDHWERVARSLLASGASFAQVAYTQEIPASSPDRPPFVRIVARPILKGDGPPVAVLFLSHETTEPKAVARLRQEQEAARLEVARQLAVALNHEINNPLFVVSATLEDLLAEATDPMSQRMLNAALEAVWRVSAAVKQLHEIRQVVSTPYIPGISMIDLQASREPRETEEEENGEGAGE